MWRGGGGGGGSLVREGEVREEDVPPSVQSTEASIW